MLYKKMSGFSDEISPDINEQFKGLTKLGIKYYEPRGINGKNISELSIGELKELKQLSDSYGIMASSIGSPIGKIKVSDDFVKHFDVFKRVVEAANILDTKYIRMFSFYPAEPGVWSNADKNSVYERLEKLIAYAKEVNVVLLHENEKDIYGDTVERCREIMETFYSENFRAVFDPANFVQTGEDTKYAYEVLKPYIEYMHIKDAKKNGEVVPVGAGEGNVEYILKELFGNGFKGFLSMEPHLGSFAGLANLELSIDKKNMQESGIATFTIACEALDGIVKKLREEKIYG